MNKVPPTPVAASTPVPPLPSLLADQRARWQRGERISTESYLLRYPALAGDADVILDLIGNELLLRLELGERPLLAEFVQRFPQWSAELKIQFQVELAIEAAGLPTELREPTQSAAPPVGADGAVPARPSGPVESGEETQPESPQVKAAAAVSIVGDNEILGELGRGGMGVVYKARHRKLQRLVALKMILAGDFAGEDQQARFRTEAESVARLQHPNIVQIYEIGEHKGLPYFSLEYCDQGSLSSRLHGQPLPPREAARLVEILARAMHYAHERAVIHRDLKPANILLQSAAGGQGSAIKGQASGVRDQGALLSADSCPPTPDSWLSTTTPKITDFGLAKKLDEADKTVTGAVMGTPAYMAPEQAFGRNKEAGPAVDIYALGVILYELLTGRRPFSGDSTLEILEQVRTREPDRPSRSQPRIHRDLETICLKALAKEPGRRYQSAGALAEDLARFNAGEPIMARPDGLARRWQRRLSRHRGAVLATLLLVTMGLAAGAWFWNWDSRNRDANQLLRRIEAAMDSPELSDDFLTKMDADLDALENLDPEKAEDARLRYHTRLAKLKEDRVRNQLLRKIEAGIDNPELSDEFVGKMQVDLAALTLLDAEKAKNTRLTFHKRQGKLLEERIRTPYLPPAEIAHLERWVDKLAVVAPDLAMPLRAELRPRKAGWNPVIRLEARDSAKLAIFEPGQVELRQDVVVPVAGEDPSRLVMTTQASSSHGEMTANFDGRWEEGTGIGLALNCVRRHGREITAMAFSPDSLALATSSGYREYDGARNRGPGKVTVWDLNGRERFTYLPAKIGAVSLAYFPDGSYLAVACDNDPIVRLLDPATGKVLHEFTAHEGAGVGSLAIARDNRTLATGSGIVRKSGEVRLWDTKTWQQIGKTYTGFATIVARLALSPNGRFLAAAGRDRSVKVWDLTTGQEKLSGLPFFFESADNTLCFTSDSRTLIAPANFKDKAGAVLRPIFLWDTASGQSKEMEIGIPASAISALALTPDNLTLAVSNSWDGSVALVDVKSGRPQQLPRQFPNYCTSLAYSPDGAYLAMGTLEGAVYVRRTDSAQVLTAIASQGGYAFTIRPGIQQDDRKPMTLKSARVQKKGFILAIERDGHVLREQTVPAEHVPAGPLQLLARRDGHRLLFAVNGRDPLQFEEVQPSPEDGVFAVVWPRETGLTSLQAMRRQAPERVSPLERGDEKFARFEYLEALRLYQEQAVVTGASEKEKEIGQEARFKTALCLMKLQRLADATAQFEQLVSESGPRWPAIAACELMLIYLNQQRSVDALFERLTDTHPTFDKLVPLVSRDFCERLLRNYNEEVEEGQFSMRPRGNDLPDLERAARIHDYFKADLVRWAKLRRMFLRTYHLHGKLDQAENTAEEMLKQASDIPTKVLIMERLSWILREKGQARLALERTGRFLKEHPQTAPPALLVERACAHVDLKQWDEAERTFDALMHLKPGEIGDGTYAQIWLACGFLRQRRGDEAGALKVWKEGSGNLVKAHGQTVDWGNVGATKALDAIWVTILGSLGGDLSTAEADRILDGLSRRTNSNKYASLVQGRITLPPGILRDMWLTPKGRECARKLAFRDLSFAESLRLPLILLGAEYTRQTAMPRDTTAEQDEVHWTACERLFQAYSQEKLQLPQIGALALTWKGTTNFLGWAGVSPTLAPELRGPLAYLIGQRYLTRLNRPDDALTFFQAALGDAPANSNLRGLAQAEVDRLRKQK